MTRFRSGLGWLSCAAVIAAAPLHAQRTDSTSTSSRPPAPEWSGVFYGTYRYGGENDTRSENRFDLDRAYLTVRAPAGDRLSLRITADVYQQRSSGSDEYYRGWTFRAKYAYADYQAGRLAGMPIVVRAGMMQTTVIEHEEQFWQRGLSSVGVELAGFFASADLGAGVIATLPNKLGELYAAAYNGAGYTSRERDRFKDFGARLTFTPFANSAGWYRTFAISPWTYIGARASDFAAGAGTVGAVEESRRKNRFGVFAGLREPGMTLGAHYGRRLDEVETADTTLDVEPLVSDQNGSILSTFAIVRPGELGLPLPRPLIAVIRHDYTRPDIDVDGFERFIIAGLGWQLNSRATAYVDWQRATAGDGLSDDQSTFFIHAIISY